MRCRGSANQHATALMSDNSFRSSAMERIQRIGGENGSQKNKTVKKKNRYVSGGKAEKVPAFRRYNNRNALLFDCVMGIVREC